MSGDILYPGSSGVACLTYESDSLVIKWEEYSADFQKLHGIDVSADGQRLFVSGRENGNLHIFDTIYGDKKQSIPLGYNLNDIEPAGLSVVYK